MAAGRMIMLKKLVLAAALVIFTASSAAALCFQDQEGNQYDISLSKQHGILTGFATALPACETEFWEVFGSFSKEGGKYNYEMTVVNPLGMDDTACVRFYKIKGQWPSGDWYYSPPDLIHDPGDTFTWKKCTALRSALETPGVSGKRQLK